MIIPKDAKLVNILKESLVMKAMISQPMRGKNDQEILDTRNRLSKVLVDKGYEIVDTLFTEDQPDAYEVHNSPLFYLSKSLKMMSQCDAVIFAKGWESARGCKIEHEAAKSYGLKIIYEEDPCDKEIAGAIIRSMFRRD